MSETLPTYRRSQRVAKRENRWTTFEIAPILMNHLEDLSKISFIDLEQVCHYGIWENLGYIQEVPSSLSIYPESRCILNNVFLGAHRYFTALYQENPSKLKEAYDILQQRIESILFDDMPYAFSYESEDSSIEEETCEECDAVLNQSEVGPLCYNCEMKKDHKIKEDLMKKGIPCKYCLKKFQYDNTYGYIICLCSLDVDY